MNINLSTFATNKIKEVEKSILSISETSYPFDRTIKNNGSTINGVTSRVSVSYQFSDSIKDFEVKIHKDSHEKVQLFQSLKNGTCEQSYYIHSKFQELLETLKDCKVGFIEVNRYEKGTNIKFVVDYQSDFDIFDNIPVSLPGINETVLTIGKDYYVAFIKRGMKTLNNGKYLDTVKRKLLSIDYTGSQYSFKFDGLEDEVSSYTRGHISNGFSTSHRVDYTVIENFLGNFIKSVVQQCGEEICILETQDSISNNAPLYQVLQEVTSIGFVPKKKEKRCNYEL